MRLILPVLLSGMLTSAGAAVPAQNPPAEPPSPDPIKMLVERLDLETYKATIKGLTGAKLRQ